MMIGKNIAGVGAWLQGDADDGDQRVVLSRTNRDTSEVRLALTMDEFYQMLDAVNWLADELRHADDPEEDTWPG
jgi:hypothetical protein